MAKQSRAAARTQRTETPRVGLVLKRARVHRGLSLREVERRIGRSNAYLSQVERGLIRQPDPAVLLELAHLYKLDFMSLAAWAGWAASETQPLRESNAATTLLIRRVLELDDLGRAQVMALVEELLHAKRR
jgi:transcriptional regulator with XRE-family HTH domain